MGIERVEKLPDWERLSKKTDLDNDEKIES